MDADLPVMAGRDVVAYFSLPSGANGTMGVADFSHTYHGFTFHFSTSEHRDLFSSSPESYLPQFGGFCSWGVSSESFWSWEDVQANGPAANPDVWAIVDGRLYFFMYPCLTATL